MVYVELKLLRSFSRYSSSCRGLVTGDKTAFEALVIISVRSDLGHGVNTKSVLVIGMVEIDIEIPFWSLSLHQAFVLLQLRNGFLPHLSGESF